MSDIGLFGSGREFGQIVWVAPGEAATNATGGYPFLIQLVGYHAWRQQRNEPRITANDVAWALPAVAERLGRQVIEPALQPLSGGATRIGAGS